MTVKLVLKKWFLILSILNVLSLPVAEIFAFQLNEKSHKGERLVQIQLVLDYLHTVGEMRYDWTTSIPINEASDQVRSSGIQSFSQDTLHTYYNDSISSQLTQSVSDYFTRKGIPCKPDDVKLRYTSFDIIHDIYQRSDLGPNNTVLIVAPTFGFYILQAAEHNLDVQLVFAQESNGFKITPEELDEALTNTKPKILIFTNPVNPTGVFYDKKEVEALAEVIKKHNVHTISDEIFSDIQYDNERKHCSLASIHEMYHRTTTLSGIGKSRGVRLSFACTPLSFIQQTPISGILKPVQRAGIQALMPSQENVQFLKDSLDEYKLRVQLVKKFVSESNKILNNYYKTKSIEYIALYTEPNSTNIILISFPGFKDCKIDNISLESGLDMAKFLYHKTGIATVPGEGFFIDGDKMVLRIPISVPARELTTGLNLILEALCV